MLLKILAEPGDDPDLSVTVSEVMLRDVPSIDSSTLTLDAIRTMRDSGISCLPVVDDGKLVGMVTERDVLDIASTLLEKQLAEAPTS